MIFTNNMFFSVRANSYRRVKWRFFVFCSFVCLFLFLLSLLFISDIYAYTDVPWVLSSHLLFYKMPLHLAMWMHFFSSGRALLNEQACLFYVLSIRFQTRIGLLKLDANTKSKEWNLFVPHLDSNKHIRHPPPLCPFVQCPGKCMVVLTLI